MARSRHWLSNTLLFASSVLLDLSTARAQATVAKAQPGKLWANSRVVWIYAKPRLTPNGLGYLRAGASVELKSLAPVPGPGCAKGWYAVEPEGYICNDHKVTRRPGRYVKAMQQARARDRPLPFSYALSNHAPMYRRLPGEAEWQQHERYLGAPGSFGALSWGNRGHEKLAEVRAIPARDGVPSFFRNGGSVSKQRESRVLRRMIPLGSMLAYTKSFEHAGRTWLLSADGTLVPADRVRPFRESTFQGLKLGSSVKLPLAWVKSESEPQFVRTSSGAFEAASAHWPVHSPVPLESVAALTSGGVSYLRTQQHDQHGRPLFVRDKNVSVVTAPDKRPWGIGEHEKWLSISITRGVLVAYQGLTPVFTTLVSPGAGGVPVKGRDLVKWSTTPMGRFRVTFKHLAADMSPDQGENRRFWIADVPYTQYFSPPFAIHVAYWHENFGEPMSAGCVNVSPLDGKWLFEWTSPHLPSGWNGVGPSALSGQGTVIIITR